MGLSEEEKSKIIQELENRIKSKGKTLICPICSNNNFALSDGYTRRFLNDKINQITLGGLNIPSITVICTNCGHIIDFSVGVLGLLPKEEGKNDEQKK